MTDERIKEAFEKWCESMSKTDRPSVNKMILPNANFLGFTAGFKTAERLAKIEVLEELLSFAEDQGLTVIGIKAFARTMIKALEEK